MRNDTSQSHWPKMPWSPPHMGYKWNNLASSLACLPVTLAKYDMIVNQTWVTKVGGLLACLLNCSGWKSLKLEHQRAVICFICLMAWFTKFDLILSCVLASILLVNLSFHLKLSTCNLLLLKIIFFFAYMFTWTLVNGSSMTKMLQFQTISSRSKSKIKILLTKFKVRCFILSTIAEMK